MTRLRSTSRIQPRKKKSVTSSRMSHKSCCVHHAIEDNIPCLLFRAKYDESLPIIFVNKFVKNITGYNIKDFGKGRSKTLLTMVHPDDKRLLRYTIDRSVKEKEAFILECRLVKKNGSIIWVRSGGEIVTDTGGSQAYVDGYMMDISDSKNLEDNIIESELRFRSIFEGCLDGILVMDVETLRFVSANQAMCRMLDYSLKELLKLGMDNIQPVEMLPQLRKAFRVQVKDDKLLARNIPMVAKDGNMFYCDITTSKMLFGGRECVMGLFHDVTDRKKYDDAVRDSEIRLQSLTEASMEGVCFHVDGAVMDVNKQLPQMLGTTVLDMIGRNIVDYVAADSRAEFAQKMASKKICALEHMMLDRSGAGYYVETHFLSTTYKGREVGAIVIRDVDQRKKVEDELRSERAFSTSLIDTAYAFIVILDVDGKIVFINKYFEEICGYLLEELRGRSWFDIFIKTKDRPSIQRVLDDVYRQGSLNGVVNAITVRSGAEMLVEWHNKVMPQPDGSSLVLAIGNDVSERIRMVESLQASERMMRQIIDTAPFGAHTYELKQDGALVFVGYNKAAERILGVPHAEFIGKALAELFPPLLATAIPDLYRSVAGTGESRDAVYVSYNKGPCYGIFEVVAFQSAPMCVTAFFRDVTERKKAEDVIKNSEERFRIVAGKTGELIYDCNGLTGSVVWAGAVKEITGYSESEFSAVDIRRWDVLVHPDDLGRVISEREKAGQGHCDFCVEYRLRRKDGTYIYVEDHGVFVDPADGVGFRMLGAVMDVTMRKNAETARLEMERQMMQSQKLKSLELLAGGIAHNYNNILMIILGHLDMAVDELSPMSQARLNVNEAIKGAKRAADLTKQLLAYVGKGMAILNTVSLSVAVSDVLILLKSTISRQVKLDIDLMRDIPLTKAYMSQLQLVIVNLLINAQESLGERGGMITVKTGVQRCDATYLNGNMTGVKIKPGEYVFLEVSDNGCGMDAEAQANIFNPFYSTKDTGRGMGLPACLGVMKNLSGGILFFSEEGKGTIFRLLFPVCDVTDTGTSVKSQAAYASPDMFHGNVLLWEPDGGVRELASIMLTRLGFTVENVDDSQELLSRLRAKTVQFEPKFMLATFSVLLSNGARYLEELLVSNKNFRLVIACSKDLSDIPDWVINHPHIAMLRKPYKISDLRDALVRVLAEV